MRALLLCALGVLVVPGAVTSASSAQTRGCPTSVDRAHLVRATGRGSLVGRRTGHRVQLVLLHVSRSAFRVAIAGRHSCRVDLVRFEHRWKSAPYQLHARLQGPAGSWEIRVAFEHYDAARHVLRARGLLEDHCVASCRETSAIASQADNSTEIVYASTFVPFDSSF
jgi:hypothetical protein